MASSAIAGILGGLNLASLKKILTFSSIAHLAWIIPAILVNEKLWLIYFAVYSVVTLSIAMPVSFINLKSINQINLMPSSPLNKIAILVAILSLGGLPPFLGVAPKILLISNLLTNHFTSYVIRLLALILVVSSMVTLFFYIKVFISSRPLYLPRTNNHPIFKTSLFIAIISSISIAGNI